MHCNIQVPLVQLRITENYKLAISIIFVRVYQPALLQTNHILSQIVLFVVRYTSFNQNLLVQTEYCTKCAKI